MAPVRGRAPGAAGQGRAQAPARTGWCQVRSRSGSAASGEMMGRAGGRGGCVGLARTVPVPRLSELLWTGRSSGAQRTLGWRCPLCGGPRPLQAQATPPDPALCRHRPNPLPGWLLQAKATPLPDPPSIGEGQAPLPGPPSADIGHAPPPNAGISPAETQLPGLQPRPRPQSLGLLLPISCVTCLRGAIRLLPAQAPLSNGPESPCLRAALQA